MTLKLNGYKEYEPPANLKPYLFCYWSYFIESLNMTEFITPIIPDGCIDIIFDLNCPSSFNRFVVGAMTKPIVNTKTNLIGVRFRPGAAYSFLKIPIHELTDQIVEYDEFVEHAEDNLSIQLAKIKTTNEQISFLNRMFNQKLIGLEPVVPQVLLAINTIMQTNGKYDIAKLSNQVGWSRQHLARECLKYIGISPKFFSQVVRVKKIIENFKTEKLHDWSQLSIDGGYYDQSHMINEFRKITGLTPVKYLTRQ